MIHFIAVSSISLKKKLSGEELTSSRPFRARIGIVVFSQGCTLGYLILPLWGIKTKMQHCLSSHVVFFPGILGGSPGPPLSP
jgi:hypothetical protein